MMKSPKEIENELFNLSTSSLKRIAKFGSGERKKAAKRLLKDQEVGRSQRKNKKNPFSIDAGKFLK